MMPAKGRYFLNEGGDGPDQTALYEKYRLTSQHGPLLLTFLLVAVTACIALIVITFVCGDPSGHQAFLGMAFFTLALFVTLYVLVYMECLVRRWLRTLALVIWVCLMMLGYTLVLDSWMKAAPTWAQVPFFLFIVFVVYTLLPFSMRGAIVAGGFSSISHLLVLGVLMGAFTKPSDWVVRQLVANAVIFLCGNLTGAFHKHQMQDASRELFTYTVKCIQIRRKLRIEKRQQENLLLSVLPAHISMGMKLAIIERLKERGDRRYVPDNNFHSLYVKRHQNVSILYADIVGFTRLASDCSPKELVVVLNELFGKFDQIAKSQQPPPPSQHLPRPKGDAALKMRASVRMTRYLESWGAARPFAHLNHRESVSSGETPVPSGRRPKTIPLRRHRTPDRSSSPKGRSEDDSYDEEMLSAIEGLSSTRPCCSKSDDFSTFGSIFLEKDFEREYRLAPIPRARHYFACASLIFVCIMLVQVLLLRSRAVLGLSFGLVACVVALVLGLCFAHEFLRCCPARGVLQAISESVETQPLLRLSLAILTIGSLLSVAIVNLLLMPFLAPELPVGNQTSPSPMDVGNMCEPLLYYTCSCILAFVACSVFLRMSLELKVVLLTMALVAYLVLFNIHPCWRMDCCGLMANLTETSGTLSSPPCVWKDPKVMINFYLVLFYVTLLMLSRQIDYYCRLDCLWKTKFKKEHEEFETMENVNRLLLENVLPAHVAAHFIGDKLNEDWYHQSYDCVCVMFASVPDFKVFYTECDVNKEGLECLRLLNEIIADFDELLLKPKFSSVEKIKTIGSTYMAAAGLSSPSGTENQDLERQHAHIGIMVEFSIALMSKLDGINRHSFNSFRLRVGINHGPVIAGVIGARKPQYDIWGNTVNVASRMESTGELGKIQVTEETCATLQGLGYSCECRGLINVKGKGELRTYFVCTDTAKFQGLGLN
ncbi:adenylate cyclase type 7 isoform X6 [Mustela erminea]|uniref:adenylate cyclase type 7 isoform X6 n=1 Tax=Mustela erminea TaxID=36723 RepID=UPI001386D528|nr:adenylate cyclase type 7 isoform X6 [Mustela erminea]